MTLLFSLLTAAFAAPVQGYVDLHIHLAAHLAVPVYGHGLDVPPPENQTYHHALQQQIFTEQLLQGDATLYVSLAYANPFFTAFETPASMKARILRQLDYVESFAKQHADRFVVAHTPAEAREAIAHGKTVILHGIEGATKILYTSEDAQEWARRGVAVVTPMHLADNRLGAALCLGGNMVSLNLWGCIADQISPTTHGLTATGRRLIPALADAGIVIDLAHTSPESFTEIADLLADRGAAPVYTHVKAMAVRNLPSAVSDTQLRRIYGLGGLVGVTAKYDDIAPFPPLPGSENCENSIDDFRLQYNHVVRVAAGAPVAWGSDFQGGIDHLRPKYGPEGCLEARSDGRPLSELDQKGLAHVGLVKPFFEELARTGSDRGPLDASAERLLEIWELARKERATIGDEAARP